jgi:cell division protein FtsI (penicillin-binding protein 3)
MGRSQSKTVYQVFLSATLIAFLILALRLLFVILPAAKRKTYQDPVVSPRVVRGTIIDRNGRILAIETPYSSLYFHLSKIKDMDGLATLLSPYLGMSVDEIKAQAGKYTTYALIKKEIEPTQLEALRKVITSKGLTQQVSVEDHTGRTYPASFHASQLVGFVDSQNNGLEGIEYTQNNLLSPTPQVGTEATTYGQDIMLTLDVDIQYLVDLQLQQIADTQHPDYAVGIVLDAKSGDILAMGSYPWYDASRISSSTETSRINHAVNYLYEPGSVFKVFSLASDMEIGQADLNTPFVCDGSYTFSGITINCHEPHGVVTPREMIAKSCNGAIAHWSMQTDPQAFYEKLCAFGFNGSYDIGLPSRSRARINDPSKWSLRSQATISFGQELSVTALHLAVAATAFANSGTVLLPHLILQRSDGTATGTQGTVRFERTVEQGATVTSPEVAKTILSYMQSATEEGGTAVKAAVPGVQVAAKTGTAQILNPQTNSYADGSVLASTLALVPADDPKYIIYIAAGNPKGDTIWGANIASPAVGEVIKGLVSQGKVISSLSRPLP